MRVSFYATLRKIVGTKHIELDLPADPVLDDVLRAVLSNHPALKDELLDESGRLSRHVHLFVNGRSSKWLPEGMQTSIRPDDTIELFPAVAGG